jgi:hypothetical protein
MINPKSRNYFLVELLLVLNSPSRLANFFNASGQGIVQTNDLGRTLGTGSGLCFLPRVVIFSCVPPPP